MLDGCGIDERRADAHGDGAGANPVAGVVRRDAPGRDQFHLGQRRADILDELRSEHRGGEHLHEVRAALMRCEDFGWGKTTRYCRHSRLVAGTHDVGAKHGTDDELGAGIDDSLRRVGVGHRPAADQNAGGQLRRNLANQIDRPRHRHRHLDGADAAGGQRRDDCAQLVRILQADHSHDAQMFDRAGDRPTSTSRFDVHAMNLL